MDDEAYRRFRAECVYRAEAYLFASLEMGRDPRDETRLANLIAQARLLGVTNDERRAVEGHLASKAARGLVAN